MLTDQCCWGCKLWLIIVEIIMTVHWSSVSNPVPWQNWMAAYLGYSLSMKTLFCGWPVMAHETHMRRSAWTMLYFGWLVVVHLTLLVCTVQKTENHFRIRFIKIGTVQKFDICSDGFPTETACNLQFEWKVTKITLLAFSAQIKSILTLILFLNQLW